MSKTNTLYAITLTGKNTPLRRGNARKTTWTSPRWVKYHLGARYGRTASGAGYDIHTINLETGSITKMSGTAFLTLLEPVEKIHAETLKVLGYAADLATLETLVKTGVLVANEHMRVVDYLRTKDITC